MGEEKTDQTPSYRGARTISDNLERVAGRHAPAVVRQPLASIDLGILSTPDLDELEGLMRAALAGIALERLKRSGWQVDESGDVDAPAIPVTEHSYVLRNPHIGRMIHVAEPYLIGGADIRRLEELAAGGWHVGLGSKISLHLPGLTHVILVESRESFEKGGDDAMIWFGASIIQPRLEPAPAAEPITLDLLMELQPGLRELRDDVMEMAMHPPPGVRAEQLWVIGPDGSRETGVLARLLRLIGQAVEPGPPTRRELDPRVKSEEAYMVAVQALYDLLVEGESGFPE